MLRNAENQPIYPAWKIGLIVVCLALLFLNGFFPSGTMLNAEGVTTLSIFVGTMLLMILVDLTWPVLLAVAALTMAGIFSMTDALQMAFGNHIFMFVLMNTLVLAVLRDCGVLRRIAVWMMTRSLARKSPWFLLGAMYLSELILGFFMNCTVIVILYCTIAETIFESLHLKKGDKMAEQIMVGVLAVCALSYGASPVGHPVAIIGIELFSALESINYAQFMLVGAVVSAVFFALLMLSMRFLFKLDLSPFQKFDIDLLKEGIGPLTKEEVVSVSVFALIVVWWVLPGLIQSSMPGVYTVMNELGNCFPLLLAIGFFCIVPVNGKLMMHYETSLKRDASWQAAYPMATAMLLSAALTRPEAGITEFVSSVLTPVLGNMPAFVFVLVVCGVATFLTNFSNITIIVTLFGTVAATLMQSGVITGVAVGAFCIAFSISSCFALATVSSTYGAIVFSSGWINRKTQLKEGLYFSFIGWAVTCFLGYFIGTILF